MAKKCILCNKDIPSNAEICTICGMSQNVELRKCTNSNCQQNYYKGADWCPHCGCTISDEAKEKLKNEEFGKQKRLKDTIKTLKRKLSEEQESKNDLECKLQSEIKRLKKDNEALTALKNNQQKAAIELIKEEKKVAEYLPIIIIGGILALIAIVIIILYK